MALFTVIIPAYNVEKYLDDAARSCIDQTFRDWRAIIVDDGSSDGTRLVAEKYAKFDSRFSVIARKNGGLSVARNSAIAQADGEYIVFLDGDDMLYPGVLEKYAELIWNFHTDIVLASGYCCFYGSDIKDCCIRRGDFKTDELISGHGAFAELMRNRRNIQASSVWMKCYRTELFRKHDLRYIDGRIYEDEEWTPRVFYYAKTAVFCDIPAIYYRMRYGSLTRAASNNHILSEISNALEMANFAEEHNEDLHFSDVLFEDALFQYASFIPRPAYTLSDKFRALRQRRISGISGKLRISPLFSRISRRGRMLYLLPRCSELFPPLLALFHFAIKLKNLRKK